MYKSEVVFMIRILLSLFIATSLFAQDTDGKKATKSVIVKDHWSKYINFYSNIGEEASNFEAILFSEILNFKNTQSLKKFSSADNTRFVLSAYELQHRDVVDFVREGLAKGFHFKIVVDGNLLEEFKPLSKAQLEKLTDHQRSFYYTSYDLNRDGIVDADDAAKYNKRYRVTKWCWSQLQQLQSENKRNLKLISSPYEVVPARENLN